MNLIETSWLVNLSSRPKHVLVRGWTPRPWEHPLTVLEWVGPDNSQLAHLTNQEAQAVLMALGAPLGPDGPENEMGAME